jgi:hypothetical protein
MLRWQVSVKGFLALLLTALVSNAIASAADKDTPKTEGTVKGIVTDKRDDYLMVRADGQEDPVKYVYGPNSD